MFILQDPVSNQTVEISYKAAIQSALLKGLIEEIGQESFSEPIPVMCENYQFEDLQTVVATLERHVTNPMKTIPQPIRKPLNEIVDKEDFELVNVTFDNIDKITRMLNLAIYLNISSLYQLCIAGLINMSSESSPQELADKLHLIYTDIITRETEEQISKEIDTSMSH